MKHKFRWILITWLVMPSWVHACSIVGLEHEIPFVAGSTELSATEVSRLTHWYLDKKKDLGMSELSLFATQVGGDSRSGDVARARLANVDALLRPLDRSGLLVVRAHLEESQVSMDAIVAIAQPACTQTASCCQTQKIQ